MVKYDNSNSGGFGSMENAGLPFGKTSVQQASHAAAKSHKRLGTRFSPKYNPEKYRDGVKKVVNKNYFPRRKKTV